MSISSIKDLNRSTKVIQNLTKVGQSTTQRVSMPSTSYFMPKKFLDVKIKEEKIEDELNGTSNVPSSFLETKIKEEEPDEYFSTTYNPNITSKPLNSTVTSTSETIVSTKVVTLPASNLLKSRKIIVIKKPVTPGTKPPSGHIFGRALTSQIKSSPGGTESSIFRTNLIRISVTLSPFRVSCDRNRLIENFNISNPTYGDQTVLKVYS